MSLLINGSTGLLKKDFQEHLHEFSSFIGLARSHHVTDDCSHFEYCCDRNAQSRQATSTRFVEQCLYPIFLNPNAIELKWQLNWHARFLAPRIQITKRNERPDFVTIFALLYHCDALKLKNIPLRIYLIIC